MSDVPAAAAPRWRPLSALDRRVVGVLVEKAKTTPEGYPMSLNALRAGCNQKSNRHPLMEVEPEDVEESLARLRAAGAVAEVQGGGRVSRYRHLMYEWLGVDKVELAVMAELLLRGAQTEGELRGRAARMEAIADLGALRPVLASLKSKNLVVSLSPEGRGHVVTHALHEPAELEKMRATHHAGHAHGDDEPRPTALGEAQSPRRPDRSPAVADEQKAWATRESVEELRRALDEVRAELEILRGKLSELTG